MSHPTCNPWAVIDTVTRHLSREGIPSRMTGEQISQARNAAIDLLRALNVEPVIPEDDDDEEAAR